MPLSLGNSQRRAVKLNPAAPGGGLADITLTRGLSRDPDTQFEAVNGSRVSGAGPAKPVEPASPGCMHRVGTQPVDRSRRRAIDWSWGRLVDRAWRRVIKG